MNETNWRILDPSFTTPVRAFFGAFSLLVVITGVVGNFLVCVITIHTKPIRKSTNILIGNLAFVDLLQCLNFSTTFATLATDEWMFGHIGCQVSGYLVVCLVTVSLYLLALISINRFTLTCYPTKHQSMFTTKNTTSMVIATWILAIVAAIPPLLGYEWAAFVFRQERCLCTMNFDKSFKYFLVVFVVVLLAPFTIIAVLNWKIFRAVRRSRRQIHDDRNYKTTDINSDTSNGERSDSQVSINMVDAKSPRQSTVICDEVARKYEKNLANSDMMRTTFMLFVIAFIFVIVYMPTMTINLIEMINPRYPINIWVDMFFITLAFSNHAINAFVYGAMNKQYRKAFRKMLLFC